MDFKHSRYYGSHVNRAKASGDGYRMKNSQD